MNNVTSHQLINQSSGRTEYYTPEAIVEAARMTMGGIDLDPASSFVANKRVSAVKYYSRPFFDDTVGVPGELKTRRFYDNGGLSYEWYGRVWMNHPFGTGERACKSNCQKKRCRKRGWHTADDLPGNADWINKLVSEYESGRVEQACCITFASTSEAWFRPLLHFPICFLHGRTNYIDLATGKAMNGATKGSCVTYLGRNVEEFIYEFEEVYGLGCVMVPPILDIFFRK